MWSNVRVANRTHQVTFLSVCKFIKHHGKQWLPVSKGSYKCMHYIVLRASLPTLSLSHILSSDAIHYAAVCGRQTVVKGHIYRGSSIKRLEHGTVHRFKEAYHMMRTHIRRIHKEVCTHESHRSWARHVCRRTTLLQRTTKLPLFVTSKEGRLKRNKRRRHMSRAQRRTAVLQTRRRRAARFHGHADTDSAPFAGKISEAGGWGQDP